MQCRDARELLDSFLAEELLVETNHELLRHLSGCAECKADLDARAMLRRRVKQAFERQEDFRIRPEFVGEVAERLRTAALAPRRPWRTGWFTAVAASAVLVVAATMYFRERAPQEAALAAGDHQNCAVKFALSERPIPLDQAAARYDPAYARLRTVPPDEVRTAAGTLQVAERHSCVFRNRRFGHVVLRLDRQHLVSLLMTTDGSLHGGAGASELRWLPSVEGLSMASYQTPGHVVYIVSDLREPAFRQVAQSLAETRVAALEDFSIPFGPAKPGR